MHKSAGMGTAAIMRSGYLTLFLAFTSAADAQLVNIYWTNFTGAQPGIHRTDPSGSNHAFLVNISSGGLRQLAVDLGGGHLYWADRQTNLIERANLDGTGRTTILSGLKGPYGLSLDLINDKMYWVDQDSPQAVRRANLDGTAAQNLVTSGVPNPIGITVHVEGGKVYWTDRGDNSVKRANLDGTVVQTLINSGLSSPIGIGVDHDGGKIYFVDSNSLERSNLDGSARETLISSGISTGNELAVDPIADHVYWIEQSEGVYRANFDGTGMVQVVSANISDAYGLALGIYQNQACCLPDASCTDVAAADCQTAGGTAQGPGSQCATQADADSDGSPDSCEQCDNDPGKLFPGICGWRRRGYRLGYRRRSGLQ